MIHARRECLAHARYSLRGLSYQSNLTCYIQKLFQTPPSGAFFLPLLQLLTYHTNYANIVVIIKKTNMSIFQRKTVTFDAVDPLGDGLGDDIAAERREADAITSLEDNDPADLAAFWGGVVDDAKKDQDWFDFSNE